MALSGLMDVKPKRGRPAGFVVSEETKAKLRDHGGRKRKNWRMIENGYVLVYVGRGFPGARPAGWISEHRLVAARTLGRPLTRDEVVHHIDRDRQNNSPENLQVMTRVEHHKSHQCECCGRPF